MSLKKCFLCDREFSDKNISINENCDYKCWFDVDMDEKIKLISEYEEKNGCSFRKLSKFSIIICCFVAFIFLLVSIIAVMGSTFAYYSVYMMMFGLMLVFVFYYVLLV